MKIRIRNLLLTLVIILGLITAMTPVASAAEIEVAKVKAVGTGYAYDSAKSTYAPTFSSLIAYDSDNSKIDVDDFVWSTPFYTKASFGSSYQLTTEPAVDETYYFGIYVDQYVDGISYDYTSSGDMMTNSVVTLPGFTVECISFMEREMGFYLELTYAATRIPDIYVGGVGMVNGDYLAVGATATTTTKPADNYAYFKDGVLTLHNYTYSGPGYAANSETTAAIYAKSDVTIQLEGENSLTVTAASGTSVEECAIYACKDLILKEGTGGGKLTAKAPYTCVYVVSDLTIENGTYDLTANEEAAIYVSLYHLVIRDGNFKLTGQEYGIEVYSGELVIYKGTFDIHAKTESGISVWKGITIHQGDFTVLSDESAIQSRDSYVYLKNGTYRLTAKDLDESTSETGISAIWGDTSVKIDDGTYEITSDSHGIYTKTGSITLKDGTYQIQSGDAGICAKVGPLTVQNGEFTINSEKAGLLVNGDNDLIIAGGTIEIDADSTGIQNEKKDVIIKDGEITVSSKQNGISAAGTLKIDGGEIVAKSTNTSEDSTYCAISGEAGITIASTLYAYGANEPDGKLKIFNPANNTQYDLVEIHADPIRLKEVYVGGIDLSEGEYLAVGGLVPTTTQPDGGYAHYASGVLTLHNYTYSGKGYKYKNIPYTEYAFIYTMVDCTIVLEGTNTLTWEGTYLQYDKGRGIVPLGALTVTAASADASLTMVTDEDGILASTAVAITGGNINIDATDSGNGIHIKSGGSLTIQNTELSIDSCYEGINSEDGSIVIQNSTLEIWPELNACIEAVGDIIIEDSSMEIQCAEDAILTTGTVTVSGSSFVSVRSLATSNDSTCSAFDVTALVVDPALTVQASTSTFSGLGTYVEANRDTYDWIVISETGIPSPEIYVGGIGMASGQYLATGATVPTTTQPTGGYAHYASGVLTLHDYTYTGIGLAYDSDVFVSVLYEGDLTVKLEGTNVMDCQTPGGEYDGSCGLYIFGNLVLDAVENASLDIDTVTPSGSFFGGGAICANGSLTFRDGTYTLQSGIRTGDDMTIEDGTFDITVLNYDVGLYANQDITIKGGTFTIDGGYCSIEADNQLVIEDGIFTLTPDGNGLYTYSGSVTIKNGILKINCPDIGIHGDTGVTIQDGSIAIQSMDVGIDTDNSSSVTITGGDLWITAMYEGINTGSTTVTSGNLSVRSTDTSNDSGWHAIHGALTVASGLPIQASTEPTGGLGAYEAAAHDAYDWIVIGTIEDTPMSYAVVTYAKPYNAGTVTGAGMYEAGSSVTATAIPDEHHNFANWTEGGTVVSTNASYTFTIGANRDLTANFEPKNYTVNVSASPAGTGVVSGGGTYPYNSFITITATANPGYHFVKWTKDGVDFDTNATKSFSLEGNCNLVAVFKSDNPTYTVSVSASPAEGGNVAGAGTFNKDTSVTVTATANTGYHFLKWTEGGADVSTNASYTFSVTANRTLVAVFEADVPIPIPSYTITFHSDGGSAVAAQTVEQGNTATKPADPTKSGYTFKGWYLGDSAYDFSKPVTGNITLKAKWEKNADPVPPTDPPHTHSWVDATCTAPKTCSTCSATEGSAKGHTEVAVPGKAATCTEKGLTDGKKCSACGTITVAQNEIAIKDHSFKDGKCSACGTADPDYVPPTQPTDPAPTEPAPTMPAPTEPKPTDPEPTTPEPTEPAKPTVSGVIRVAGDNRYSTGLEVAERLKKHLAIEKFSAIVVASGREFPDALAGSYLANQKKAPILLVNSKDAKSFDNAKNYIAANLATGGTVYILGGEAAVPAQMEKVLSGYNVKRLAGSNRYGTNLEILKEAGTAGQEILICTGKGFADSLSASAVKKPILLLNNKTITADQKAFLENSSKKFIIIGGTSAISAEMEAQLKAIGSVERVYGDNRYKTSVAVANRFFTNPDKVVVAYAKKFPDGLCGGPLGNSLNAPLILTAAKVEAAAAAYVKANGIKNGYVLGGTSALSDETVAKVFG